MPDSWANWKDTWQQLGSLYGIKHQDTDMSSAQEIAKFAAEKANATADIGDVGGAFSPVAVKQGSPSPTNPPPGPTFRTGPRTPTALDAGLYRHHRLPDQQGSGQGRPPSWQSLLGGDYKGDPG